VPDPAGLEDSGDLFAGESRSVGTGLPDETGPHAVDTSPSS